MDPPPLTNNYFQINEYLSSLGRVYPPLRKPLGMPKPHFQGFPLCLRALKWGFWGVAKCCHALASQTARKTSVFIRVSMFSFTPYDTCFIAVNTLSFTIFSLFAGITYSLLIPACFNSLREGFLVPFSSLLICLHSKSVTRITQIITNFICELTFCFLKLHEKDRPSIACPAQRQT